MAKAQQQGQRPAKSNEPAVVTVPEEAPFRYYVPGEKPKTDQAYFELLLLNILRTNGDLANFDEVWPRAVQSLAGMNLLRLSTYATHDVREAIAAVGGDFSTRMSGQAESIILWAGSMWRIRQIYGTFRRYIRSFETDGLDALLEDLKSRLPGLSPEFLTAFLRDAGEKVPVPERQPSARPSQQPRQSLPPDSRGSDQQRRQPQQQQQQPQQKQDGGQSGRGDRRRRQRGRGGARPPQQQPQAGAKNLQPQAATPPPVEAKTGVEESPKDPQQQQRRRNRRRFFRRRRPGGGDKPGATPAAE